MPSLSVVTITPARRIQGRIRVPGDKSISHRYALLAALSDGRSELHNYAPGADCRSTLTCLRALGLLISINGDTVTVDGRGVHGFASPSTPLDAGNSGTTMRMLAGMLAGQPFDARMVGDESLSRRPMLRVIDPLARMGARIEPPMAMPRSRFTDRHCAIAYQTPVPSAQVKSAVILAALRGRHDGVTGPPDAHHTERALAAFGSAGGHGAHGVDRGGQRGIAQRLPVPGDFHPPPSGWWRPPRTRLQVTLEDVGEPRAPPSLACCGVLGRAWTCTKPRSAGEPMGTIVVWRADRVRWFSPWRCQG
jgi:3-phosphoshikimate 1-carboxyvinyltransferase